MHSCFYFVYFCKLVSACLSSFVPCVYSAQEDQKRAAELWNWSQRWLWWNWSQRWLWAALWVGGRNLTLLEELSVFLPTDTSLLHPFLPCYFYIMALALPQVSFHSSCSCIHSHPANRKRDSLLLEWDFSSSKATSFLLFENFINVFW